MHTIYARSVAQLAGRALSTLDFERTSPSYGSFDRTWWCWKFTDFSATRFQEGTCLLAWLLTSPQAPAHAAGSARLRDGAAAAIAFWSRLQHGDGCFDEAYPFERSLAATAFSTFYIANAVERLGERLDRAERDGALATIARAGQWLAANGEYHGILSNHLAAAAAALQLAGDVTGSDRFSAGRNRYLDLIARHQHPEEGWMMEYGGADPGYQSHAMFYLAEIQKRTGSAEWLERLRHAARFIGWFAHPDGTLGGEHASRGTKFTYPAAFEMLAAQCPASAAIARHNRAMMAAGRGVTAQEMDAWNQFPLLNNLLFAADAAGPLTAEGPLPWQAEGASALFPAAGMAVVHRPGRVVAVGGRTGGVVKVWEPGGALVYEDCGYAVRRGKAALSSQGTSTVTFDRAEDGTLAIGVQAAFKTLPATRFTPVTFLGFRLFTLTVGRMPALARWLKMLLVKVLIHARPNDGLMLDRTITILPDGRVVIDDRLSGADAEPQPLARQVPYHMGSSRYADTLDQCGARLAPPPAVAEGGRRYRRSVTVPSGERL